MRKPKKGVFKFTLFNNGKILKRVVVVNATSESQANRVLNSLINNQTETQNERNKR